MRHTILAAAAAFIIGGAMTGTLIAQAQPATNAPPSQESPAGMGWMPHPGMHRHADMMDGARRGGPAVGFRALALVYRQQDRALSAADVQKIAEAFLLWNGNHTWKVANVTSNADGMIDFSVTTQEGSNIARFTMDPHTARLTRVG